MRVLQTVMAVVELHDAVFHLHYDVVQTCVELAELFDDCVDFA